MIIMMQLITFKTKTGCTTPRSITDWQTSKTKCAET